MERGWKWGLAKRRSREREREERERDRQRERERQRERGGEERVVVVDFSGRLRTMKKETLTIFRAISGELIVYMYFLNYWCSFPC